MGKWRQRSCIMSVKKNRTRNIRALLNRRTYMHNENMCLAENLPSKHMQEVSGSCLRLPKITQKLMKGR